MQTVANSGLAGVKHAVSGTSYTILADVQRRDATCTDTWIPAPVSATEAARRLSLAAVLAAPADIEAQLATLKALPTCEPVLSITAGEACVGGARHCSHFSAQRLMCSLELLCHAAGNIAARQAEETKRAVAEGRASTFQQLLADVWKHGGEGWPRVGLVTVRCGGPAGCSFLNVCT